MRIVPLLAESIIVTLGMSLGKRTIGLVLNAGSELMTRGIKNLGDRTIKSDSTKRQLEKMFKTEAKNQGKKIKNKELPIKSWRNLIQ
jgi:hypothetical protein